MADINFVLDTEPMAERVNDVTVSVGAVGTAVTAMQVAVVKTQREATDTICRNLDNGFYMMVRSNLSQKVSQFTSSMNSRIGSMLETAQAIDHTRDQMDQDFHRIKARYVKLFDGLDKALQSRIRTLDRNAMGLAESRSSLLLGRQCKEAPAALYFGREIQVAALKAANAHMKVHAQKSLGSLGDGAGHIVSYAQATGTVLKDRTSNQAAQVLLPVVYAQVESLTTSNSYVTTVNLPQGSPEEVTDSARTTFEPLVPTMASSGAGDMRMVRQAFVRELARQGVPQRERDLMLGLFDSSAIGGQAATRGDAS